MIPEDTPKYALWLIRSYVRKNGHKLGRTENGVATCNNCGAVMVDTDAYDYFKNADESVLGVFTQVCK